VQSVLGGGFNLCKGPEAGICPACLRNSRREVDWSRVKRRGVRAVQGGWRGRSLKVLEKL